MMAESDIDGDIAEIDAFLADQKTLMPEAPIWGPSVRPGELQAIWGVVESSGINRAELRFRCASLDRSEPSISLIFRRRLVCRLDIVPPHVWKPNPHGAANMGLPPSVNGTHLHEWEFNKRHCRRNGFGDVPFRSQLNVLISTTSAGLGGLGRAD